MSDPRASVEPFSTGDTDENSQHIRQDSTSSGSKRRRTALACSACRVRKSRCDGCRPKCASCQRMGFECTYEMPNSSSNLIISKNAITSLESRIEELESIIRLHQTRLDTIYSENSCVTPKSLRSDLDSSNLIVPAGTVIVDLQNQEADRQSLEPETDGMAISLIDDDDYGYFGPSSNISLMRIIFQTMSQTSDMSVPSEDQSTRRSSKCDGNILIIPRPELPKSISEHSRGQVDLVWHNHLPPDNETMALIRKYFDNTGSLFPYIHEPSFFETYHQLKQSNFRKNVRRTWLGLLNMILAMAICVTKRANLDSEFPELVDSGIFYMRAQELCKKQILRGTTLESVQYLLLTTQYLQGTQKAVQTWITHGLAVRSAISIGLHSKEALKKMPPIDQEMGKRTWFGCILLDRSLSMTYGRPSAIPECYIRLELPLVIVGDVDGGISVAFYNGTITLYKILWKIVGSLYGHNLGCEETFERDTVAQIFQLQQELDEWKHSLPEELRLISSSNINDVDLQIPRAARFRFILTLRYLNTQLLLRRPLLTNILKSNINATQHIYFERGQEELTRDCAKSAEEIIFILHSVLMNKKLGEDFLGAWWFTIYYAFNAALVTFGSLLIPHDEMDTKIWGESSTERGRRTLMQAIEALVQLGNRNALLDRCVAYLRRVACLAEEWSTFSRTGSAAIRNQSLGGVFDGNGLSFPGIFDPNLIIDLPLLPSNTEFEDEVELGPFVNSEFQRWFAGAPWQKD